MTSFIPYNYKLSVASDTEYILTINETNYLIGDVVYMVLDENSKGNTFEGTLEKIRTFFKNPDIKDEEIKSLIDGEIIPLLTKETVEKKKNPVKSLFVVFEPKNGIRYFKLIDKIFTPLFFWSTFIFLSLYSLLFLYLNNTLLHIALDLTYHWIYAFLFTLFIIFVHEIGHVIAASRYNIVAKSVGFGFYFIYPAFYTDLTAIWKLNKSERIIINLGGIYFQLILNVVLSILILSSDSYRSLFISFFFSNTMILFFNLNPLFKFDGYWIFSDFFELHNLRETSNRILLGFIRKNNALKEVRKNKIPLVIYSICYVVFMAIVWTIIVRYFYISSENLYLELKINGLTNFSSYETIKKVFVFVLTFYLVFNIVVSTLNLKKYFR